MSVVGGEQQALDFSPRTEQEREIERVSDRIAHLIMKFAKHVQTNERGEFVMAELLEYVSQRAQVAPDSPGRILRDLRASGRISYEVVNRAASLYRITRVKEGA